MMKIELLILGIGFLARVSFGQVGSIDATIGFVNNYSNKMEARDVKQLSNGHIITCGKNVSGGSSFIHEADNIGNFVFGQTVGSPCLYALDTIDASSYVAVGKLTGQNNSLLINRSFPYANQTVTFNASAQNIEVFDIVTQPDGKFVVCGLESLDGVINKFFVGRINADLTVDNTFGNNGSVLLSFGNDAQARSLALQHDGKIVIVGHSISNVNELIVRLNSDGSLDNTFFSVGYLEQQHNNLTTAAELYGVAVGSDNSIYTVGKRIKGSQFTLFQWIKPNQVLSEIQQVSMENWYTITLQPDSNKVIIGGQSSVNQQGEIYPLVYRYRLTSNDTYEPDLSFNGFNNNGVYTTGYTHVSSDVTFGSYLQRDGKILLSGMFNDKMFITRLNNDFIPSALGVADNQLNNELTVYPNPSQGIFSLNTNAIIKNVTAFALGGEQIATHYLNNEVTISAPAGIYFLRVETEKSTQIVKIQIF